MNLGSSTGQFPGNVKRSSRRENAWGDVNMLRPIAALRCDVRPPAGVLYDNFVVDVDVMDVDVADVGFHVVPAPGQFS